MRWSSGILRLNDVAVDGFTIGPRDKHGRLSPEATDDCTFGSAAIYGSYIVDWVEKLFGKAIELGLGEPLIAVEAPSPPQGFRDIPLRAWYVPTVVAAEVIGRFGAVSMIPADGNGKRHLPKNGGDGDMTAYYPDVLCRRRPADWLANEEPRTSRDHERAAYDVAGRALAERLAA